MNLWLRLVWMLICLPFMAKQRDPMAITKLTMRVLPNDLDTNLHVNNGRYLTMMDLGRFHLMAVTGLLKQIRKRRWIPMLGSVKVHFIRELNVFNKFTMTTQVVYWDEKWFYLEQKIFKGDKLHVVALIKTLFIDKNGKIKPEQMFEFLPKPPQRPAIPRAVKFWIDAEKASRMDPNTNDTQAS